MSNKSIIKIILALIILAQLAALLPVCVPPGIADYKNEGERQRAVCNMKLLYNALERFRAEYGSYPSDATAALIATRYPGMDAATLRGETANAYLRQLFYMAEPADEHQFYAKLMGNEGKESTRKGDNQLQEKALEMGENAMGYILHRGELGQRESVQAGGEPTPLLICALCPFDRPYAAHKMWLDNYSLRGHVFVLYTNGRVRDHEEDCVEDEWDDSVTYPARSFFPAQPDGSDSARQHIALPPLLPIPRSFTKLRATCSVGSNAHE